MDHDNIYRVSPRSPTLPCLRLFPFILLPLKLTSWLKTLFRYAYIDLRKLNGRIHYRWTATHL